MRDINLSSVTATLSAKDALHTLKKSLGHGVKTNTKNSSVELIIYSIGGHEVLAYKVSYFAELADQPARPFAIIDAHSGEILESFNALTTKKGGNGGGKKPGNGGGTTTPTTNFDATGLSGNTKSGQYYYGGDFAALKVGEANGSCTMVNSNVRTVNMNHSTRGGSVYSFTCPENTYKSINGAYSPLNDAHAFGNVIFDMYREWYNTAPSNLKCVLITAEITKMRFGTVQQ